MSKVVYEFQVGKYKVLKLSSLPTEPFTKANIRGEIYKLVPLYDLPNCIAIESQESFIGSEIILD